MAIQNADGVTRTLRLDASGNSQPTLSAPMTRAAAIWCGHRSHVALALVPTKIANVPSTTRITQATGRMGGSGKTWAGTSAIPQPAAAKAFEASRETRRQSSLSDAMMISNWPPVAPVIARAVPCDSTSAKRRPLPGAKSISARLTPPRNTRARWRAVGPLASWPVRTGTDWRKTDRSGSVTRTM